MSVFDDDDGEDDSGFPDYLDDDRIVSESLEGRLLVAMPNMPDDRFEKAVIYICAHSDAGAMGLVVNKPQEGMQFVDLLEQLEIDMDGIDDSIMVHYGGPVETGRGFVLHSPDYAQDTTLAVNGDYGLTATLDILRDMAVGTGPRMALMALGYAGWGAGQLDAEMQANGWLVCDADEDLLFGEDLSQKWYKALEKIGIDLNMFSNEAGHA